mmetsp:Transcript_8199/g.11830  ORF Transcript_8199/g.11830 Transcript_8199/m.11830 type:complete len:428 (+) Transcript_8199:162-1445(+)
MDLLKQEMERKRKAIELARLKPLPGSNNSLAPERFRRAGSIRRLQEEREEREQNERKKQKYSALQKFKDQKKQQNSIQEHPEDQSTHDSSRSESEVSQKTKDISSTKKETNASSNSSLPTSKVASGETTPSLELKELSSLSPSEVTIRLRQMGLPVRLFGESTKRKSKGKFNDEQRVQRISQAIQQEKDAMVGRSEMDEYRLGKGHGIRNPFLGGRQNDDDDNDNHRDTKDRHQQRHGEKSKEGASKQDSTVAKGGEGDSKDKNDEDENDPHKLIYRFFKDLLRQWEEDLAMRPEQVKRSVTGRNDTKTVKQCKDYIRPLFKQCKSRRLEPGIMAKLLQIIEFAKEGEFVKAHDCYMDVAIGRAAWPIGVTMVGIHARSGRAKIESSNVAHVMNSELQRKYLTSVKRLLTYCQKKRKDVAPSKKVIN